MLTPGCTVGHSIFKLIVDFLRWCQVERSLRSFLASLLSVPVTVMNLVVGSDCHCRVIATRLLLCNASTRLCSNVRSRAAFSAVLNGQWFCCIFVERAEVFRKNAIMVDDDVNTNLRSTRCVRTIEQLQLTGDIAARPQIHLERAASIFDRTKVHQIYNLGSVSPLCARLRQVDT